MTKKIVEYHQHPMKKNSDKKTVRILVPLLQDYYIFEYFYQLIPVLCTRGFDVTVATFDPGVRRRMQTECPDAKIVSAPRVLRFLNNRSKYLSIRAVLWLAGWTWGMTLPRSYDFAIVPWTNKVLWHVVSRCLPSLTCNNTTNFFNLEIEAEEKGLLEKGSLNLVHKCGFMLERAGLIKLARISGKAVKFTGLQLLDLFLGGRSVTRLHGFNGISYLCVMGEQVRRNYLDTGVDPEQTEIKITGNPGYERVRLVQDQFDEKARLEFLGEQGFPTERPIYALFLSPSSFSDIQRQEIKEVVSTISKVKPEAFFVIKFHPKTNRGELAKFKSILDSHEEDVLFISAYLGEDHNTKILLSSECMLLKQGTVGYIALYLGTPIISYDICKTDYLDDMYEKLSSSFHCRTAKDIEEAMVRLDTEAGRDEMAALQLAASRKFCVRVASPCNEVANVIEQHFSW